MTLTRQKLVGNKNKQKKWRFLFTVFPRVFFTKPAGSMPISINSLAGAYRQRDNPRWSRAHHVKLLEKMHKGVSLRALRQLRRGKPPATTGPSDAGGAGKSPRATVARRLSHALQVLPSTSPMGAPKKRLPLYTENDEITECMRRRGRASLLKHPPVSVEHRMAGRDLIATASIICTMQHGWNLCSRRGPCSAKISRMPTVLCMTCAR